MAVPYFVGIVAEGDHGVGATLRRVLAEMVERLLARRLGEVHGDAELAAE